MRFCGVQARGKKRQIGWFPANYVKLLGPSSARSTPDAQAQRASSLGVSSHSGLSTSPLPVPPHTAAPAYTSVQYVHIIVNLHLLGCVNAVFALCY